MVSVFLHFFGMSPCYDGGAFFFLMATFVACGTSQAKDWIQFAAVTYDAAVTMPYSLTHYAGPAIKLAPLQ